MPSPSFAAFLRDVISSNGGEYTLDPGVVYTEGCFLLAGTTTTINANGAVIDLIAGTDSNIGTQENITLVIRNATIRGGGGIYLGQGARFTGEFLRLEDNRNAILVAPGAEVTLGDSVIEGALDNAISGNGGIITLNDVDFRQGRSILLFNGAQLFYNGGLVEQGLGTEVGINLLSSSLRAGLVVNDVTIRGYDSAVVATNFSQALFENTTIENCRRGIDLHNAPDFSSSVRNVVIDGSMRGDDSSVKQDAIVANNIGTLFVENVEIRKMRSGVVATGIRRATVKDSRFVQNLSNSINYFNVAERSQITNSYLQGAPIRGIIDVDDFDTVFLQNSMVDVEDCMIIDSADNGILAFKTDLTVRRSFIAGSRITGVAGRRILSDPSNATGSRVEIADSTILNSQLQNISLDSTSELVVRRTLLGLTPEVRAFPSTPTFPASERLQGTGIQSFSPRYDILHTMILDPVDYGLQIADSASSPISGGRVARFVTMRGIPNVTSEGALYVNAGPSHILSESHLFGVSGSERRTVIAIGNSSLGELKRNWLGDPGGIGLLYDGTTFLDATDNYFGHPTGPSGSVGGQGSFAGGIAGRSSVQPFATEAPMHSAVGSVEVAADGRGTGSIDIGSLRITAEYRGQPASRLSADGAQPYSALLGATEYFRNSLIGGLPGVLPNERRTAFNLWMDTRLHHYLTGNGDELKLTFRLLDNSFIPYAATLVTDGRGGVSERTSTTIIETAQGPAVQFTFASRDEIPAGTMVLRMYRVDGTILQLLGLTNDGADVNGDGVIDAADALVVILAP